MARVTISEIEGLLDPLTSDMFEFRISGIDESKDLRILCQSVSLPAKTVELINVDLACHSLVYAGKMTFEHALTITFIETRELKIFNALDKWVTKCRNHETQTGLYKYDGANGYAKEGVLEIFNQKGESVKKIYYHGLWGGATPSYDFSNSESSLLTASCTFNFDYWDEFSIDSASWL